MSNFNLVSWRNRAFNVVADHLLAQGVLGLGAVLLVWTLSNTAFALIAIAVALVAWALFTILRDAPQTAARRHWLASGAVVVGMCLLAGGVSLRTPPAAEEAEARVPRGTFEELMHFAAAEHADPAQALRDLLDRFQADLVRLGWREPRIEVAVYDPDARCLRIPSESYVVGWRTSLLSRAYPIPGVTPTGGTSVCGVAWKDRRRVALADGPTSPIYFRFDDDADDRYGMSRSLTATPIALDAAVSVDPIAVVTVASPIPNQSSRQYHEIIDAYAAALKIHFARNGSGLHGTAEPFECLDFTLAGLSSAPNQDTP